MEGNNFDLRGIGNLLASTELYHLQCAGLQLLEHAAKWQKTNFNECTSVTFGPVADLLLDSRDIQVHCAALDTLQLFLESPHATDIVKSMMPRGVVDVVSNDLNSPEPDVQLASVELLEVAARSKEIRNEFAVPISRISGALPSMPAATQVTALRVIELCMGSNEHEIIKALAANSPHLKEPLSSPEDIVQNAALKVSEASARSEDPDISRAAQPLLWDVRNILSSGETDLSSAFSPPQPDGLPHTLDPTNEDTLAQRGPVGVPPSRAGPGALASRSGSLPLPLMSERPRAQVRHLFVPPHTSTHSTFLAPRPCR